jgi:hypothetical protein
MSNGLIRRLKERIQSEPTVDVELHFGPFCPPIRPRPPVSEQTLAEAEAQLGFPLPPLVRALYTQVADGGFGPGYGVIQLTGHPYALIESRLRMDEEDDYGEFFAPEWVWPERLVQFVNWGCHYFSGIDCSNPSCPVFFYDNDRAGEDTTLADCLSLESDSLMEWLSAWLDGEDLWERGTRCGLHS